MKNRSVWLGLLSISSLTACNNNATESSSTSKLDTIKPVQEPRRITAVDSAFLFGWNSFANNKSGFKKTFDIPINPELADECIRAYETAFQNTQGFTSAVLFNTAALKDWTVRSGAFDTRNQLFVLQFGIYTQNVIDRLNNDADPTNNIGLDHLNRITIFISPYQTFTSSTQTRGVNSSNQTIAPFNLGSLHPAP